MEFPNLELSTYRTKIAELLFAADQDILKVVMRVNMPIDKYVKHYGHKKVVQKLLVLMTVQKHLQDALNVIDDYGKYTAKHTR